MSFADHPSLAACASDCCRLGEAQQDPRQNIQWTREFVAGHARESGHSVPWIHPWIRKSANQFLMKRVRGSVISSIAYRTPSRPKPEAFTPPYGKLSMRSDGASFTITAPTSSASKASSTQPTSRVKTEACRP